MNTGGTILEAFLDFGAPYQGHRLWRTFVNRLGPDGNPQPLSQDEMDKLLDLTLNSFTAFFVTTAGEQSQQGANQILLRSMYARYHGVSRSALNLFAKGGFFTPIRTFDRELIKKHGELKDEVKSESQN